MKQGMTRKLAPKDKHSKASWKKRDEGRKGKQKAYSAPQILVDPVIFDQAQGLRRDDAS